MVNTFYSLKTRNLTFSSVADAESYLDYCLNHFDDPEFGEDYQKDASEIQRHMPQIKKWFKLIDKLR